MSRNDPAQARPPAERRAISRLLANDVRSGKVQVVFRGFETATPDPHTFQTQQVAALAAGQQSHFGAARHDPSLVSQVNSEEQAGGADGIKGTPTLVFHGPKGSTQVPAAVPSYGRLQQVLQSVA